MSKQTIEERVKILIANKLGVGLDEVVNDATFKKELSLLDIQKLGIQLDFNFGTGAEGCKSGWCRG